jgi:aspartate/methionine/tyrosine aminotransferase
MGDAKYPDHLEKRAVMFRNRADEAFEAFKDIPGITLQKPQGALYATAVFHDDILQNGTLAKGTLPVKDESLRKYIEEKTETVAPDKRFVYWLLAATGICVVPLSGFASELPGFRFTLLEHDDEKRHWIFKTLGESVRAYLDSVK